MTKSTFSNMLNQKATVKAVGRPLKTRTAVKTPWTAVKLWTPKKLGG